MPGSVSQSEAWAQRAMPVRWNRILLHESITCRLLYPCTPQELEFDLPLVCRCAEIEGFAGLALPFDCPRTSSSSCLGGVRGPGRISSNPNP